MMMKVVEGNSRIVAGREALQPRRRERPVEGEPRVTEDGEPTTSEGEALLMEDGDKLLTEAGESIELEGAEPVTVDGEPLTYDGDPITYGGEPVASEGAQDGGEESRAYSATFDASQWTGSPSRAARLIAVRQELGAARDALEFLIDDLADPDGNGGPSSMEHDEALEALRELHACLGKLLDAIDAGRMDDELGETFAADIARFAADCLASLRDNAARATVAVTTLATLSACGLPTLGGLAASGVLMVRKGARKKRGNEGRPSDMRPD